MIGGGGRGCVAVPEWSLVVLAHAHVVARRVVERGHREVALRIWRRGDLAAVGDHLVERLPDVADEHVGAHPAVAGHRQLGLEVADDVAGAVLEAVALAVPRPPEDGLIEVRRRARVRRGDAEIREPARPEDLLAHGRHTRVCCAWSTIWNQPASVMSRATRWTSSFPGRQPIFASSAWQNDSRSSGSCTSRARP